MLTGKHSLVIRLLVLILSGLLSSCGGGGDGGSGPLGDGDPNPEVPLTWYADSDNDGFGDAGKSTQAVAPPAGYVANLDPRRCARLYGAAEALREAIGAPLRPAELRERERRVALVRAALGDEVLEAAWSEGRALTPDQALRREAESA